MTRLLTAFLASLALASAAHAQNLSVLPSNTVVGNMGPAPALGSAVPLATLQAKVFGIERPVADANYAMVATDRIIAYTSISAAHTVTLLSAAAFPPGTIMTLLDRSGSASGTNTITIAPTGADKINGSNASLIAIQTALGGVQIESDGVQNWTVIGNPTSNSAIPNSKLAAMAAGTVKCNDTAGSTTPSDCAHLAFYFHKNGTAQTGMTTGAYSRVTWSTAKFNTTGNALSSNTWTAPVSGMILMEGSVWWTANAAGTSSPSFVAKFIKNSAGTCNGQDVFAGIGNFIPGYAGAGGQATAKAVGIDQATAGDVYELCAFGTSQDSTNDLQVDGNMAHVHWSGAYIR